MVIAHCKQFLGRVTCKFCEIMVVVLSAPVYVLQPELKVAVAVGFRCECLFVRHLTTPAGMGTVLITELCENLDFRGSIC